MGAAGLACLVIGLPVGNALERSNGEVPGLLASAVALAFPATFLCGIAFGLFPRWITVVLRHWKRPSGELGEFGQLWHRTIGVVWIGLGLTVHDGGASKWEPVEGWDAPGSAKRRWL